MIANDSLPFEKTWKDACETHLHSSVGKQSSKL